MDTHQYQSVLVQLNISRLRLSMVTLAINQFIYWPKTRLLIIPGGRNTPATLAPHTPLAGGCGTRPSQHIPQHNRGIVVTTWGGCHRGQCTVYWRLLVSRCPRMMRCWGVVASLTDNLIVKHDQHQQHLPPLFHQMMMEMGVTHPHPSPSPPTLSDITKVTLVPGPAADQIKSQ